MIKKYLLLIAGVLIQVTFSTRAFAFISCTGTLTAGSGPYLSNTSQFTQSGSQYNYSNAANNNFSGTLDVELAATTFTVSNFTNSGQICGNTFGLYQDRGTTITTLSNSGLISSTYIGLWVQSTGAPTNGAIITTLNNSGTIQATTAGGNAVSVGSGAQIGTLNNTNVIVGANYGISNSGTITNLTNGQGGNSSSAATTALTMTGAIPLNYNILITNSTHYGQLVAYSSTGSSLNFGISSQSTAGTAILGTYTSVLNGITSSMLAGSTSAATSFSGTSNGYSYTLNETALNSNLWNLTVGSVDITTNGSIYSSSLIGTNVNRRFDGGTLQLTSAGNLTGAFTITSNNGKIDQNGTAAIFSGNITDDSAGVHGKLIISNSGTAGQGSVSLNGSNTYSGGTEVDAGANLKIASSNALGTGSLALVGSLTTPAILTITGTTTISNPISVTGDPIFNISPGTTTTVSTPITDGASTGDIVVDGGGTLALTAANTYTGPTTINTGSTLALIGNGSINTSASVTNNGTMDITGKTGNASLGGSFTQGASGSLIMNFASANNQQLNIVGAANLAGALSLNASSGSYNVGRYTLLTASSITGTFSNLTSNLSSYTNLTSSLSYDSTTVYLNLILSGPSSADTQSSVNYLANQLQSTYAIQSSLISNSLTYDCAVFDKNGICISAGAGYTAVNSGTPSVGSGLLIGGYKLTDQVRLGAWVNQKAYNTGTVGLNAANSNPMFGLYAVWNQEKSGNGLEVRASAGYETNSTTSTRQVFGTSEAGVGTASLTTQGASLTASYNIPTIANLVASPYVGVRYTKIGLGGYTESSGATTPLTYGDLNQENTTVLAGVKLFGKVASKVGVFGSVGVEQDIQNNAAAIQASGSGQTLTNASLTSSYQATRPVATAGAYYELDKAQRVTFNAGYTQSMYMPVAVSSAYVTYTAGF